MSTAPSSPGDGIRYVGFNQLRSFHAVAKAGSVTKAARMLHVSQPTVTTQLRQLERAYGVELVHRSARGLQLTDLGAALYRVTERIFALEQEAVSLLTDASGALTGALRVGSVGPYFAMQLLAEFSHRHPTIQLSLAFDNSVEVVKDIHEYRIDIGIVGQPASHPLPDRRLIAVHYSRQQVVIVTHRGHRWAERDGIRLAELANEPLVLRERGSVSRRALEESLAAANVQVTPALEVSREGVWEAVAAGLGVGITTDVEFPRDDRLRMVRILDADVGTDAYIISLRERQEAPLIRAFRSVATDLSERMRGHRGSSPGFSSSGEDARDASRA